MTAAAGILEQPLSVEAYLEQEKSSDIKHEYYFGKLIPMAGEKKKANRISNNINLKLSPALLEKGFEVYMHDVKAAVKPGYIYRYPDFMVALTEEGDEYIVFSPILVVEVASEDSLSRDRGKKLSEYTALSSMVYYLIVNQEEMLVEFYTREGDKWTVAVLNQSDAVLHFPVFGLQLTLTDIYAGVHIEAG